MKEIWIVEGIVTNAEAYDGKARVGDTEWQFSDGPSGKRGSSADYLSIEGGIRAYAAGTIFHFEPAPDLVLSGYEVTVKFKVPCEEFIAFWKHHQEVLSPEQTMADLLQRDLYDECGMAGEFTVENLEFKEKLQ